MGRAMEDVPGNTHSLDPALILYQTEDGRTRLQCRLEGQTLWLTQAQMAELFQVTTPTIDEHLQGLLTDGEVSAGPTIRSF